MRSCSAIRSLGSSSVATASASKAWRGRWAVPWLGGASNRAAVSSRVAASSLSWSRPMISASSASVNGLPATASALSIARASAPHRAARATNSSASRAGNANGCARRCESVIAAATSCSVKDG